MKTCKQCGLLHRNKVFCSIKCHHMWQTKHAATYDKVCRNCNKHFTGGSDKKRTNFCSTKCKYLSMRKNKDLIKTCLRCNELIIYSRETRNNKFCCHDCSAKYKTDQVVKAWIEDSSTATAKQGGLSNAIRNHLISEANGKCNRCGRSDIHPVTGNYVVEVDHVDGDRYNNTPENLEVLCANCHSLTPTFKGGNARSKTVVVPPKPQSTIAELLALKPVIGLWLDDDSIHNGKDTLPASIREYLIAKAGYKCSIKSCKWGEVNKYTGLVPVEVDHVDGDAHNNTKANLKVLCPQCHACTPNHRALRKVSSRVNRKKKLVT